MFLDNMLYFPPFVIYVDMCLVGGYKSFQSRSSLNTGSLTPTLLLDITKKGFVPQADQTIAVRKARGEV
jgi:hypothetical protein